MDSPLPDASSWGNSFRAGLKSGSPILMGLGPVAIIYGASAREAGLSLWQTIGMSLGVFAGSAQLIFVNLWAENVSLTALIITCLVVNLRHLIYSASISTHLGAPPTFKSGLFRAYFLTDEGYSVSMSKFMGPKFSGYKPAFFLGAALPTWLGWQIIGIIGYLAGAFLPKNLPLSMAIPLIFLSLLITLLESSSTRRNPRIWAALTGGVAAIVLEKLPLNLGLILAIFIGVAAGILVENLGQRRGTK